jgi:hypothetical protein
LRKRNELTPAARMTMDVLRDVRTARISDFERLMHQRGCTSEAMKSAVGGLIRRRWLSVDGLLLILTDRGRQAVEA